MINTVQKYALPLVVMSLLISSCSVSKKASKAFENGEFQESITQYENILNKNPDDPEANFYMAEAYRLSNRASEAIPYYQKAIDNKLENDSLGFFYAYALKSSGDYDQAGKQLDRFIASTSNELYLKRANDELQNLNYLEEVKSKKNFFRVKNMDKINTSGAEYSPVYEDGLLYFTSNRGNSKIYKATGTPFSNIYTAATKGAKIDSTTIKSVSDIINDNNVNDGSVSFSPDGKTMVFAKANSGKKKGTYDVNLYSSRLRNGTWTEPKQLNINKLNSFDSSPAFSRDGKMLYFASNRPGGLGGTDIYSARKSARGRYSKVKNLGSTINTAGNEMFPYISDDGHMYFSSDGHPGFGGLDLFYAKRSNGKTTIENLGMPVNSNADDFGMYLFKPDRGFFTSNRQGGHGDDDIYTFVNEDPDLKIVNYFLRGISMTHNDQDSLVILPKTKVEILDFNGEILGDVVTGDDGKFLFRVYEHEHYQLIGEHAAGNTQYLKTRVDFTTFGKSIPQEELTKLVTNVHFDTLMVLEKIEMNKTFVLENIYYDLDKWDIRPDAEEELDKLVQILVDNPDIKIELSSHTDDRAPDAYNMTLSDKRANSAVRYIISQGIDKDRMTAKGYGESELIIQSAQTEEQHQVNRRTEFKILELGQKPNEEKTEEESTDDEDRFFDGDGE
jgi:outer membrane protein OmpA-like peptidoglycan-associated protein/tetratricopeptide (TPR) repeat protein